MRITRGMLNRSARKAELSTGWIGTSSGSVQKKNGQSRAGSRLSALQSKNAGTVRKTQYEKQDRTSAALGSQLQKFSEKGSNSLFEKAKTSGDTSQLRDEVKTLTERYNALFSALGETKDAMNQFYRQSMRDLVNQNAKALAEIGIYAGANGKLSVDREKLEAASVESLEQMLGAKSSFASKLSYLAGRVGDNASAGLESLSGGYLRNGGYANSSYGYGRAGRYNFWG